MPSGPSHWHNFWQGDEKPWRYLAARGFADERGMIRDPAIPGFEPDTLDYAAIDYLCQEWDYGYEPTKPASLSPSGEGVEAPWLVWSNEHRAFWGPNRCGYTGLIERAGRYSQAEAEAICRSACPRANSTIHEGTPPEICMPAPEALAALSRIDIVEECAAIVDQCNREGPYNAIGAAKRIRALKQEQSDG